MIDLGSPTTVFCDRHREPLRERWPHGYAFLLMALFQLAVRDPEILRACGARAGHPADAERLGPVLREYGPLCCRFPDEIDRLTALALRPADEYGETIAALHELERRPAPEL